MPPTAGATLPSGRAEASEMPAGSATQEPGAGDNRFTCNPNDPAFEPMKELEDGKQYRICMLATQSSAGELVVDSVESAEPPGEDDMEGEDMGDMGEDTGAMGRAKDKYPNPAVAKMVKGEE